MYTLQQLIEEKRREMNGLANEYGLLDDRVLTKSRELDCLLNEYQRLVVQMEGL
ncbi:aspartyl-phosphate phosphatase Spo0E family protein [Paenibacillus sp. FSL H8-0122]|uniref:aspartyl-phosphate phosphatase Spo0E family protein n=1 Tax=Paenibacillus sp. FSL H8-0122 TaxID=2954510 RepID=UPI0030FB979A